MYIALRHNSGYEFIGYRWFSAAQSLKWVKFWCRLSEILTLEAWMKMFSNCFANRYVNIYLVNWKRSYDSKNCKTKTCSIN